MNKPWTTYKASPTAAIVIALLALGAELAFSKLAAVEVRPG